MSNVEYTNGIRHFAVRIPWKDNGFTGNIDNHPKYNMSAQIIQSIARTRDIEFEEYNKGRKYTEVGVENVWNWIIENAAFMSDKAFTCASNNKNITLNPYSFLLQSPKENRDFFSGIKQDESLIFPYFKQVPFTEDKRNVIAGIGNIVTSTKLDIGMNVTHSLNETGLLMPYIELMDYAKEHPAFDIETVTLFEPVEFQYEFLDSTGWISYDAVISILNQAKIIIERIATLHLRVANADWAQKQLTYIDAQLQHVWKQRGTLPGRETMLTIIGSEYDELVGESLQYFHLLSEMDVSRKQAIFAWGKFQWNKGEILDNPYLLYELTRRESVEYRINIFQIDDAVLGKYSHVGDKKRLRALITFVLVQATCKGHTLLQYEQIIQAINLLPLEQSIDFSASYIQEMIGFLREGKLYINEVNQTIKLEEYQEYKEIVLEITNNRLQNKISCTQNWMDIINSRFGELQKNNEKNDLLARQEKASALVIMESSKISVLVGRAGTGKTSALGVLAASSDVRRGGILALSPTGKARVQLEKSFKKGGVDAEFMTASEFLQISNGFREDTQTYVLPDKPSSSSAQTVIIDESSMLTEEMFVGMMKLVDTHAERIIFVGDPNQLPPKGAGRPFVDLLNYLTLYYPSHVATLETEMRQGKGGDDLHLAHLFSDKEDVDRDIMKRITYQQTDERLTFIQYDNTTNLEDLVISQIMKVTGMKYEDDVEQFNSSLGAIMNEYPTSKHTEDWQILTPTKFVGVGSYYLNSFLHYKYRGKIIEEWENPESICKPQSIQKIVLGDKVISNLNDKRTILTGSSDDVYLAKGEIGIMSGYPKQEEDGYLFRFGSFDSKEFIFTEQDFGGEEVESKLDLAYALTVQTIQGTGFFHSIVILDKHNPSLTKELLYTAFSRQKQRLIVLSNLSIEELLEYTSDWYSDTLRRCTDLFEVTNRAEV